MRSRHITKIVLWVLLAAVSIWIAFMGLIVNYNIILDGAYAAKLGVELKGGMHAVLTPETEGDITKEQLDTAMAVIKSRLDGKGIYDRTILADYDNKQIIIESAWEMGERDYPLQMANKELAAVGKLTFAETESDSNEASGYKKKGDTLLEGNYVTSAAFSYDSKNNQYFVIISFNADGAEKVAQVGKTLQGKNMGVFLDNELIYVFKPTANDGPYTRMAVPGGATQESAKSLANIIGSGSLPFEMEFKAGDFQAIPAVLGENTLGIFLWAGFIALVVIVLILIVCYKLSGVIASIVLAMHVALQILFLVWLDISITLPGILGILLSTGICLDASLVLFGKIREELSKGKNTTSAIADGFKNASRTIINVNILSILFAAILYLFGTGAVKGFAVSMIIGMALNFILALWMTRSMLSSADKAGMLQNEWWCGAKKGKEETQ